MGHLFIEGDQDGQAGPAFHEPMLAGPELLVVLHMPGECTQDEPLPNLPRYRGQADWPVVPWILFLDLLVDGASHWQACSCPGPPPLTRTSDKCWRVAWPQIISR